MESIGKQCTALKHQYDNCFNNWYTNKFLIGDTSPDCDHLFLKYRQCVLAVLKEKKIDALLSQAQNDMNLSFTDFTQNIKQDNKDTSSTT